MRLDKVKPVLLTRLFDYFVKQKKKERKKQNTPKEPGKGNKIDKRA